MANPQDDPRLLIIDKFGGLNSNAPRGAHTQPTVLENVYLDRTGGYSAMYAGTAQVTGVLAAKSTGLGSDLWVTQSDGTHYAQFGTLLGGVIWAGSVANAVLMMPQLLLSNDGVTYIGTAGTQPALQAAPGVSTSGTADLQWQYVNSTSGSGWSSGSLWDFLLVFEYGGTATFTAGAGVGTPPAFFGLLFTWHNAVLQGPLTLYARVNGSGGAWQLAAQFNGTNVSVDLSGTYSSVVYPPQRLTPGVAAYHQGRVFATGVADATIVSGSTVSTVTTNRGNRVWYSGVIASALNTHPRFNPLYFIDVPFRLSYGVVALLSVGAYLYIFGDRELFLLTGDPENASLYGGGKLESIGDSIGTVTPASVQQLNGVGYWLSDGGVMAVKGGQTQEIGIDVRDLIVNLNTANLSSAVDFGHDLYLLSDGVTTLVYHTAQQGWSTRQQSESGKLLSAGGVPLALNGTTLNNIGGTPGATKLTMTVQWGPFECGDWMLRKNFKTLLTGLDLASVSATVTNLSTVSGNAQLNKAQTITAGGTGRVAFHLSDGIAQSGLTVTPALSVLTQDTRGILRPPLTVYGSSGSEEMMP